MRYVPIIFILSIMLVSCATTSPYGYEEGKELTPEEHLRLGEIYEQRGELDLALREYRYAARGRRGNPMSHFAMGNLYMQRGLYMEAEDHFLAAIDMEPLNGVFHNNLGWLYIEQGRLGEAETHIRQALAMDPFRNYIYIDTLGVIYTRYRSYEEAERLLDEAAAYAPSGDKDALLHIYMHQLELYRLTGDEDKELKVLRKIRRLGGPRR
ncbi:MAG: tetratricopeptide repeat protein [Thermodesulfobacteriota bacterium]